MTKLTKFTEKQQAFVDNKAAGLTNVAAAVAAGYAPTAAGVAGGKLMSRPDVKAAIAKLRRKNGVKEGEKKVSMEMPRDHYANPLDFLTDLMNHEGMPLGVRAKAAESLMPYTNAKVGEKGKKENKKEDAREAATNGSRKPQAAPNTVTPFRQRA